MDQYTARRQMVSIERTFGACADEGAFGDMDCDSCPKRQECIDLLADSTLSAKKRATMLKELKDEAKRLYNRPREEAHV